MSKIISSILILVLLCPGLADAQMIKRKDVWKESTGKVWLNSAGNNVGVGTSTPQAKLDVAGSVKAAEFVGTLTGSATSLAANGANCSEGQVPLGIDASGAVEGCWTPTSGGNPGGSANQIQYNNAGVFGGVSGFVYNGSNLAYSGRLSVGTTDAPSDSLYVQTDSNGSGGIDLNYVPSAQGGCDAYTQTLLHLTTNANDAACDGSQDTVTGYNITYGPPTHFSANTATGVSTNSSWIDLPDGRFWSGQRTLDVWLNFSNTSTNFIYGNASSTGGPNNMKMLASTSLIHMDVWNNSYQTIISASLNLTTGTWHHFVWSMNYPTVYLYVDGVYKTHGNLNGIHTGDTSEFQIGKAGGGYSLNASMQEFRISTIARWIGSGGFIPPSRPYDSGSTVSTPKISFYGNSQHLTSLYSDGSDSNKFKVSNADGSVALTLSGGNLGVGSVNPSQKLDVSGSGTFTGNVGIGTSNPSQKLDVNGYIKSTGIGVNQAPSTTPLLVTQTSGVQTIASFKSTAGYDNVVIGNASPSWANTGSFQLYGGGNLRIGMYVNGFSAPVSYLNGIDGTQIISMSPYSNAGAGGRQGYFGVFDGGTEKIALTAGGNSYVNTAYNFGVGTSAPSQRLDVNGTVKATGYQAGSSAGVTVAGTSCTVTAVAGGIVTGATCN